MNTFSTRALIALVLLPTACGRLESEVVAFQGRNVEIVDAGDGPTTVVFEAGLGDGWEPWNRVATDLSDDARVFAYSRPGYGESDETTTARDPQHIVEDLRELLASQEVAPPFVLVGHSFGGAYMELFARAHPEEVAGLVLVDSRPADFLAECESAGLDACGVPASYVAKQGGVFEAEYNGFAEAPEQMEAAGTFGAYPVRVLTATRRAGNSRAHVELWKSMQGALADEAEDGSQTLVHAGHYLQRYRARKVARAIRGVLP